MNELVVCRAWHIQIANEIEGELARYAEGGSRHKNEGRMRCDIALHRRFASEIAEIEAENQNLREALDLSVTGIEWYHATYPDSVSECDLQQLALCEKALHPNA